MEPSLPWPGLRALAALAEHRTMTAAADALGYTTGAVSQQVAALARAAGVELTRPHGRGVVLTEAGLVLAARAETLLTTQRDAVAAAQATAHGAAGTVRIGVFATLAAGLLPRLVEAVAANHPGVTLAGLELTVDDVSTAVRRGDVDLGLGLDYPGAPIPRLPGTTLRPVHSERFWLLSAPSSGLPAAIDLAGVADLPWILPPAPTHYGAAVRGACRRAGFEPRAAHEVNDTSATLALVAQGLGVALATPLMRGIRPGHDLRASALHDVVERDIVLLENPTASSRASVGAVITAVEQVVSAAGSRPSAL